MQERYVVIASSTFYEFLAQVREKVAAGYQPIGGITVCVEKLNEHGEPAADGHEATVYYQSLFL